MQTKRSRRELVPIILLFIILNALFISGKNLLQKWNADQTVLIIGNAALFLITLFSFYITKKGLGNKNPHAFVRSVYGSTMAKMFLCLILALIYIMIYKSNLNKAALFTCMGLYLVYTFMEVSALMKLLKTQRNG